MTATIQRSDAEWRSRWRARPWLAFALRLAVLLAPVAAAALLTSVVAHLVARPASGWAQLGWFALVIGTPSLVLLVVGRVARRAMPLAVLLRMSLVFPDRAPGRFSLALRAGTTRHLQEQLEARRAGTDADPEAAARRILTLVAALGEHDRLTRGHCERVRAFNDLLADAMGLSVADRDRLRWAALLHDIGKLHVPRGILSKRSKPTTSEWEQLRRHPTDGARLTAGLSEWLGPWAASIEQHHERWDGAGYPHGLAGTDICLGARIVAVADTYEVMTTRRPYQRPVSPDAARKELARCAGTQFDPAVVRAFLNIAIGDLRRVLGPLSWLAELPFLGGLPRLEGVAAAAGKTAATLGVGTMLAAGAAPHPTATSAATPTRPRLAAADLSRGRVAVPDAETVMGGGPAGSPTTLTPPRAVPPRATPLPTTPPGPFGAQVSPSVGASASPQPTAPPTPPPTTTPAVPRVTVAGVTVPAVTVPAHAGPLAVPPVPTLPTTVTVPPLPRPAAPPSLPASPTTPPAAPPPPVPPPPAPPSAGLLGGLLGLLGKILKGG